MNLLASIQHLLTENDLIIVPEWGAFIANKTSAHIDLATGIINPPARKIAFNSRLKLSDGILVSYVSKTEGISYQDAEWMVKSGVKLWKQEIETKASLSLNEIGVFTSSNDVISFKAADKTICPPASFGLPIITLSQQFVVETVEEEQTEVIVKPLKQGFSWFNVAASILLVAVLGALVYSETYIKPLTLQNLNLLSFTAPTEPLVSTNESIPFTADEVIGADKTEATEIIPIQIDDNTLIISNQAIEEGFYIVLGSFKSEKYANKMLRKHSKLPLQVVTTDNGYNRVVLFATSQASAANNSLKYYQTSIQKSVWMFYNMH